MKRLIVVLVACVATALTAFAQAAPAAQPAAATAAPAVPVRTIAWGACQDPGLVSAGAQCGTLQVPMDYRRPDREQLRIAVSRIVHKTPDSAFKGVMMTVPGGPGLSGTGMPALAPMVPDHAGDAYDWIGFDPRGVGSSTPALSCDPTYMDYDRPDYVPSTPQLEQAWLARARGYAADCGANNDPALLANMKTTDTVADLESIRLALGVDQMSFYAFSYGTYVGQVYATLHPDHVRRMVLDSTVDARDVYYRSNLAQDAGFERNLGAFLGWVAAHDDVYHLGRTQAAVQAVFDQQLVALRAAPAAGAVGPDEWLDIFQQAGFRAQTWSMLAGVFSGWVHQADGTSLKELYEQVGGRGADNSYAVYLAVECTDTQWPTNWDQWRADTWRTYARAPHFAWLNTWFNAPCAFWPAAPGTPVEVGSDVGSMLLVDQTLDAATPYEGSLEARSRFPGSSLLAEPGGTDHASTMSGNTCVDGTIAAYLAAGTQPARLPGRRADAECRPSPPPAPQAG